MTFPTKSPERRFLFNLLEKKYGSLTAETIDIINAADHDFIDRIGEALLTSATIKEAIVKARGMQHRLISTEVDLQIGAFNEKTFF